MSDNEFCSFEKSFYGAVTVGERGQIVIPSEARREFGISAGDKLLVVAHPGKAGILLLKISGLEKFVEYLRETLSHVEKVVENVGKEETEAEQS